ncbi:hypothetical protein B0H17DRAFT_1124670 [Mycena rosella]|uniref:Uncharacterized protein n=1 Tax=Mycena rosella TaxID=1033263 RepID=A0AAD7MB56_MYCRO|nr:hypothetical protein B0H17DRAFT_1124670 [Mycena rosella]
MTLNMEVVAGAVEFPDRLGGAATSQGAADQAWASSATSAGDEHENYGSKGSTNLTDRRVFPESAGLRQEGREDGDKIGLLRRVRRHWPEEGGAREAPKHVHTTIPQPAMGRHKKTDRAPGRESAFKGEKLEWLESFEADFRKSGNQGEDRGAFYNDISKKWLTRYGYNVPFTQNVEGDMATWTPVNRKIGLTGDVLTLENNFQESTGKILRKKLSDWYCHWFTGKRVNGSTVKTILKVMHQMSGGNTRPCQKTELALYSSKYYATWMKTEFDVLWEVAKQTLGPEQRVSMCQDFVRSKFNAETPEFRAAIKVEAEEAHKAAMKKYKEARQIPEKSVEGYFEALSTWDEVSIPLADALVEHLGMHIMILAVGSVGGTRRVLLYSETSSGQTSKMWPEYDFTGFSAAEASILCYGPRDDCTARMWPPAESLEGLLQKAPGTDADIDAAAVHGVGAPVAPVFPANTVDGGSAPVAPVLPTIPVNGTTMAPVLPAVPVISGQAGCMLPAGTTQSAMLSSPSPSSDWGRLTSRAPLPPPSALPIKDGIDRYGWCESLDDLHKLMMSKEWGPHWKDLTDVIVAYEELLMHRDSSRFQSSTCRPAEYVDWMKHHRPTGDWTVSPSFGKEMLDWWRDIGLLMEWVSLHILGTNGMILVILRLSWWGQSIVNTAAGQGLGAGEAALVNSAEWNYMLDEVLWVLKEMTDEMEEEVRAEWERERAAAKEDATKRADEADEEEVAAGTKGAKGKVKEKEKRAAKRAAPKKAPAKAPGKKAGAKRKRTGDDEGVPEDVPTAKTTRSTCSSGAPAAEVPAARPRPRPRPSKKAVADAAVKAPAPVGDRQERMSRSGGGGADVEMVNTQMSKEVPVEDAETPVEAALLLLLVSPLLLLLNFAGEAAGEDPFAGGEEPFQHEFAQMSEEERRDMEAELGLDPEADDDEEDDEE